MVLSFEKCSVVVKCFDCSDGIVQWLDEEAVSPWFRQGLAFLSHYATPLLCVIWRSVGRSRSHKAGHTTLLEQSRKHGQNIMQIISRQQLHNMQRISDFPIKWKASTKWSWLLLLQRTSTSKSNWSLTMMVSVKLNLSTNWLEALVATQWLPYTWKDADNVYTILV